MRITDDVELPEALIGAAAGGDLVLFVGAGASVNAPANLPSFVQLAGQLAALTGTALDERLEPDAFIGRLCDSDPRVRERARSIIAHPDSRPNDNHRAIVRLGNASGTIRIVSTNYDEHLVAAAAELSVDIGDVYQGPAVPLGRDFSGLVFLHGRVSRNASELVITDDDFGRAYLFDGWARRFVTDLFLNRTVLFVGYSHSDAVMKYLARGLPPTTKRFALTDTPKDLKWRDLRITPIEYPSVDNHVALTTALNEWARRLEMGQLDHRARIHEIVRGGPPKLSVEEDYLASALSFPGGVRAFSEQARGEEWLLWIERQPPFLSLFVSGRETADEGRVLANWFASNYVGDTAMTDLALATIARHGPVVCVTLRQSIAWAAYSLRDASPGLATRWAVIVSAALRTHDDDPEESWNLLHSPALRGAGALPLLRRALRPRLYITVERPWYLQDAEARDRTKISVRWSSSKSDLEELWESVSQSLPSVAASVLQVVEQSMSDAYELLSACEPSPPWDAWSFRRSAIEPHEQDRFPGYEDILIDALRDSSVALIESDGSIIDRWLGSEYPLFRRLGLYLVTEDAKMSVHEKFVWLLSGTHLYGNGTKHETFRLLAAIVPELNDGDRRLLLEQILEGPAPFGIDADREEELHERSIFDLVEWLTRHVTGWRELENAVAAIRAHRPGIGTREHPDFDRWMESGSWVEDDAPFTSDELTEAFDTDGPESAVSLVVHQTYHDHAFDGPTWQGACSVVQQAAETRPDVGVALLSEPVVAKNHEWESGLRAAIITGLANATLTQEQIEAALHELQPLVIDAQLSRPLSDFFLSIVEKNAVQSSEPILARLDNLASRMWRIHAPQLDEPDADDWLMLGLNTWPGVLSQYWINRIQVRWRLQGDNWEGFSSAEKDALVDLLDPTGKTHASRAIFAAELYFLFNADPAFVIDHLFPLFERASDDGALHIWDSYFNHGRVNDEMLKAGFWALLTKASTAMAGPRSEHETGRQYWWMMASICVRSEAEVVSVPSFVASLTEADQASSFVVALAKILLDADVAESTNAWNSWIAETIRTRLASESSNTSVQERTAWSDLALNTPREIVLEALELTQAARAPLGRQTTFHHLPPEILTSHPDRIAEIVEGRLAQTVESNWHIVHELELIVTALRQHGISSKALRGLAEQGMQHGIYRAASWTEPLS